MAVAFSMHAMYADLLDGGPGVVTFVGKRPDRIVNPGMVNAFISSPVKWVFLGDSDSCTSDRMPQDARGGVRWDRQDHA
jgi:hypothetical protein